MTVRRAVAHIEKRGALLTYPLDNTRDPPSLWYEFYPRTKMRWEWDDDGDTRVADLWHLRAKLSNSGKVVYTKWFKGRATFFSCEMFTWLLASAKGRESSLSFNARALLHILEDNSPLSTKALKKEAGLQGRENEPAYTRALKELWERFLIVGFGEVDDGAFPSLAIGASKLLFEGLWHKAERMDPEEADARIRQQLADLPSFLKFYQRTRAKPSAQTSSSMR